MLFIKPTEKYTILVAWNGDCKNQYPIKYMHIHPKRVVESLEDIYIYNRNFLKYLFHSKCIIYLYVYGFHSEVCKQLRPMDVVVIYNVLLKKDKLFTNHYMQYVSEGFLYDRAIRLVEKDSILGKFSLNLLMI